MTEPKNLQDEERVAFLKDEYRKFDRERITEADRPKDLAAVVRYARKSAALISAGLDAGALIVLAYAIYGSGNWQFMQVAMVVGVMLAIAAVLYADTATLMRDGDIKIEDLVDLRIGVGAAMESINTGLFVFIIAVMMSGTILNNSALTVVAAAGVLGQVAWRLLRPRFR